MEFPPICFDPPNEIPDKLSRFLAMVTAKLFFLLFVFSLIVALLVIISCATEKQFLNLETLDVTVSRCFVGPMVTSLEMAGVSLSVLLVKDENQLQYLDSPCLVAAWPGNGLVNELDDIFTEVSLEQQKTKVENITPTEQGEKVAKITRQICETLVSKEEYLNDLDRLTGDGDTGSTMTRGATAILKRLRPDSLSLSVNDLKNFFMELSQEVETSMGGSSGALISTLFATFSSNIGNNVNLTTLADSFNAGVQAMIRYGRAEEGYRTMLDALCPASRSFKKSSENFVSVKNLVDHVSVAARKGADSTKGKVAKAGRASYVTGVQSDKNDPGAEAVALVFETLAKSFS